MPAAPFGRIRQHEQVETGEKEDDPAVAGVEGIAAGEAPDEWDEDSAFCAAREKGENRNASTNRNLCIASREYSKGELQKKQGMV